MIRRSESVARVGQPRKKENQRKRGRLQGEVKVHFGPLRLKPCGGKEGRSCLYCRSLVRTTQDTGTVYKNHLKRCHQTPGSVRDQNDSVSIAQPMPALRTHAPERLQSSEKPPRSIDQDDTKDILHDLLMMFVMNRLSFRLVEEDFFKRFIARVCPDLELHLANRRMLSGKMLEDLFSQVEADVM